MNKKQEQDISENTLIMFPASKNFPEAESTPVIPVETHNDPLADLLNEFEDLDESDEDELLATEKMNIEELEDMSTQELIAHMQIQFTQLEEYQKRIKYYLDEIENYN